MLNEWILFHLLPISLQIIIPCEKTIGSRRITTCSLLSNLIDITLKENSCYVGDFCITVLKNVLV